MSNELAVFQPATMPPTMQLFLDDKLFERTKQIASYLAKADGFTPPHLVGKSEACFFVVTRAIGWRLDPFSVACSTFQIKGKIGFEGKLCQAIIENSGQVEGGVKYKTHGDWTKVQGKFETVKSDKGNYQKATYNENDEMGLGVTAYIRVKGETEDREFKLDLREAQPRNSTLWATNPLQQLKYRAVRGLGNSAMPGIFMGVPFGKDDIRIDPIKDVTPTDNSPLKDAFMANANNTEDAIVEVKTKNKMDDILAKEPIKSHSDAKISPELTEQTDLLQQQILDAVEDSLSPMRHKADEIIVALNATTNKKELDAIWKDNVNHLSVMDNDLKDLIWATRDERLKTFGK